MMSANADAKTTAVPARLPRIIWPPRQASHATPSPASVGAVAISAIQSQFSPCTVYPAILPFSS